MLANKRPGSDRGDSVLCHSIIRIKKLLVPIKMAVVDNTSFELIIPREVESNPPPTDEELRILRDEVDRDRLYI